MSRDVNIEIEHKIISMFESMALIDVLEQEHKELEKEANLIVEDIKAVNVNLETELNFGIDYSSISVQTSPNGDSIMDKELIAAITRLEKEWREKRFCILQIKEKIRNLKSSIRPLKNKLDHIDKDKEKQKEYIKIIELKYKDKKSSKDIAKEMNLSPTTVDRRKKEVINGLAKLHMYI